MRRESVCRARCEGVAAALRENIARRGDAAGDGAPLRAIEPAIRPPAEAVRDGVRVFKPEAGEADLRVAIGHVVVVAIGIEEQERRVHHPDSAAPALDRGGDAQPIDERLLLPENAVAIRVLEDRNLVMRRVLVRRRQRRLIVNGAPEDIVAHRLQRRRGTGIGDIARPTSARAHRSSGRPAGGRRARRGVAGPPGRAGRGAPSARRPARAAARRVAECGAAGGAGSAA